MFFRRRRHKLNELAYLRELMYGQHPGMINDAYANQNATYPTIYSFIPGALSGTPPLPRQDIGYTQNVTSSFSLSPTDIADLQGIGNRVVVRYQQKWIQFQPTSSTFTPANLDASVAAANAGGVDFLLQVQTSAGWFATLDGLGCNFTLQQSLTSGNTYTSLAISALNAEAFLVPGVTYDINFGGGTAETITIAAPTGGAKYYGVGTTSINISSHMMTNNHSVGEQMYEHTQGPIYPTALQFANIMGILAQRYNGQSGHGLVLRFQIGNEEFDSNNRFGAQGAVASWDGSQSWDNGGPIAALMYNACKPAILAANPQATVMFAAVRRSANTAQISGFSPCIQHVQNWVQGAAKFCTVPVDEADFHFYHGSDINFDNSLVSDPTQDTFFDSAMTQVNSPSIQRQLGIMSTAWKSQTLVQTPRLICGEFGDDIFDDGSGFNITTNQTITAGNSYGTLTVLAIPHALANSEPVYIDNNQTTNFEVWYSFGANAINSVSINLTTDPRGNGTAGFPVAQVAPVAAFNHNSGVNCYAQNTADTVTPALSANHFAKIINAMRVVGGDSYCFTMQSNAVVSGGPPWPQQSTAPKSIVQTIGGTFTKLAPYQTMQALARSP